MTGINFLDTGKKRYDSSQLFTVLVTHIAMMQQNHRRGLEDTVYRVILGKIVILARDDPSPSQAALDCPSKVELSPQRRKVFSSP